MILGTNQEIKKTMNHFLKMYKVSIKDILQKIRVLYMRILALKLGDNLI